MNKIFQLPSADVHGAFSTPVVFAQICHDVTPATWHRPSCHTREQLQLVSVVQAAFSC